MNRIYRSIWNEKTGTVVAASEHARSTGGHNSAGTKLGGVATHVLRLLLILPLLLPFAPNTYALPVGGVVTVGGASIGRGENSNTITQSSQNVAINWQSFNIGQGESVRFIQPNSHSIALNRVLGPDPSSIFGKLSANGKVFLINPNGILFGHGAQVNVGGLVASTLNISDIDFMAGRFHFSGHSNAAVSNQGTINADGGYVALLGAQVSNEGVIQARLGTIALAAGQAMTLDMAGDGLLNVAIDRGAMNALAENGGLLQADGGQVLMTAQAAESLLPSAVNTRGIIQAQSIENKNGSIRLLGDTQGGTVNVSGTLDVSAPASGKVGGGVTVTGHHVGLVGARINASGAAGGGSVLIGGDYQGGNPAVANASATYMSADSMIAADAITRGDGGKIVLWADRSTRAYGSLSARGGALGGNGGLIETSGHWLDVAGIHVSASAAGGSPGTWLLDPNNIIIQLAGLDSNVTAGPNFTSNDDNAIVTTASIESALNAGTSVVVTTGSGGGNTQAGNITVNSALAWNHVAGPTLTLTALNDIVVNQTITATTGSLVLNAGHDATVNFATKATTGNLTFNAVNHVNLAAPTTITTGTLTAIAGQDVKVSQAITVTTGDIVLRADNDGTGPGALIGGTVTISCGADCLTITTGALKIRFNPVNYSTTNAEITAYDANLTVAATLDAKAWVFALGSDKVYDGTRNAVVNTLKPDITSAPAPGTLSTVGALFDTRIVGTDKLISFDSHTLTAPATFELWTPLGMLPAGAGTARADITAANLTVTADAKSKTYGAPDPVLSFVTGAFQTGDTAASVLGGALARAAGETVAGGPYAINQGTLVANSNYNIAFTAALLTVNPLALAGSLTAGSSIYGAALAPGVASFSNIVGADVVTPAAVLVNTAGLLSSSGHLQAGTHTGIESVSAVLAGADAANYSFTGLTANYVVAPLNTSIRGSRIYDGMVTANGTAMPIITALIGSDAVSVVGSGAVATKDVASNKAITDIGSLALAGGDAGNYALVDGTLTITQAALTITADNKNKVYGAADPVLTASYGAFQPGDNSSAVTGMSLATASGAAATSGIHTIDVSGASATNYAITEIDGTLTVSKAALTITADNKAKVYGAADPVLTASYGTFQYGDTPAVVSGLSLTTVTGAAATAGTHTIDASGACASNYTIAEIDGTLTVSKAALTITADDKAKVYGAADPVLTASYGAFQYGDTPAVVSGLGLATVTGTAAKAGTHVIDASGASALNYSVIEVDGTLTVTPLALVGSITAADKTYDATSSAIITGRSLAGILGTDAVTYSGGTAVFDTPLVGIGKPVTATALGLSGADASNYTVNSTAATTATITPVITPPVVPPVIPPVIPPVVVPPIEPPPIDPPPVEPATSEPTPAEHPAAEEKLGIEEHFTPAAWRQDLPSVMPVLVRTRLPPQLENLAASVVPVITAAALPPPLAILDQLPAPTYVSPLRPRKHDRN